MAAADSSVPQRPVAIPLRADTIPEDLKRLCQWNVWRYEWDAKGEKWTKVPYNARSGRRSATTDVTALRPFEEVVRTLEYSQGRADDLRYDGIGFVFRSKLSDVVGIDFDKCRDPQSGAITPRVLEILRRLNTYCEVSPSGTGVKAFGRGKWRDHGRKHIGSDLIMEIYGDGRY